MAIKSILISFDNDAGGQAESDNFVEEYDADNKYTGPFHEADPLFGEWCIRFHAERARNASLAYYYSILYAVADLGFEVGDVITSFKSVWSKHMSIHSGTSAISITNYLYTGNTAWPTENLIGSRAVGFIDTEDNWVDYQNVVPDQADGAENITVALDTVITLRHRFSGSSDNSPTNYTDTYIDNWRMDIHYTATNPVEEISGSITQGVYSVGGNLTWLGLSDSFISGALTQGAYNVGGALTWLPGPEVISGALIQGAYSINGTLVSPDIRLTGFQFRKHFADEAHHQYMQPKNSNINALADEAYALRLVLENIGDGDLSSQEFTLEYQKNGGAWTPVTETSNEVKSNPYSVKGDFYVDPYWLGNVYQSQFLSLPVALVEAPPGVIHEITSGQGGLCLASNPYYLTYRRSTDNGITWSGTFVLRGENWFNNDPDCQQATLYPMGLLSVRDGSNMFVAYHDLLNDATDGEFGSVIRSVDNGVTWANQYPLDPDPSHRLNRAGTDYLQGYHRFALTENGTLFHFMSGRSAGGSPYLHSSLLCVYKSTDHGATWSYTELFYRDAQSEWQFVYAISMGVNRDNGYVYCLVRDMDNFDLYRTTDNGTTWSVVSTVFTVDNNYKTLKETNPEAFHVDAYGVIYVARHKISYASGYSTAEEVQLEVSHDHGVTWETSYVSPHIPNEAFVSSIYDTLRISSSLTPSPHTQRMVITVNEWVYGKLGYGDLGDQTTGKKLAGPMWFQSEDGVLWTLPVRTRLQDDYNYYYDLYEVDDGYYDPFIYPLVGYWGDVHYGIRIYVSYPGNRGYKSHFDSSAVYRNGYDVTTFDMGSAYGNAIDVYNAGYSYDGTFGPNAFKAGTAHEVDIKLMADSGFMNNGDYLDFRINEAISDVTPRMTVAATENVWPGTTGTTITAGVHVRGRAVIPAPIVNIVEPNQHIHKAGLFLLPKLTKFSAHKRIASIISVGAAFKQVPKYITASVEGSGFINLAKTTVYTILSYLFTIGAGNHLKKQVNLNLNGFSGFAGSIKKQTIKLLNGSSTLTGIIAHLSQKAIQAIINASGEVYRLSRVSHFVSGTIELAGDVSNFAIKALTSSIRLAGDLYKQTTVTYTGTIGFVGEVTKKSWHYFDKSLVLAGSLFKTTLLSFYKRINLYGVLDSLGITRGDIIEFVLCITRKSYVIACNVDCNMTRTLLLNSQHLTTRKQFTVQICQNLQTELEV